MTTGAPDGWFVRRMMRLTPFERWAVNNPHHAQHTMQTALRLLEYVDLPPHPRCLEIGCGQGALARLLVERYGARVVASDYDPDQVAVARKRLRDLGGQVVLRVVDARTVPFEEEQFDAVFSFGVLHHIPGGWRQVIVEATCVLQSDGWFVMTDFVLPPLAGRWLRRLFPRLDQLEETALHAIPTENGLHLEHYERGPHGILTGLGLMGHCATVASLNR